ncbi:MAG: tungstate ABC transporter substrate-binding protein WtpA [Kiritimatiellaeota bacterium]|nr:tungstate ABC transporter substrate-binding protein WtpA [Kiritimatiellota bacterium]
MMVGDETMKTRRRGPVVSRSAACSGAYWLLAFGLFVAGGCGGPTLRPPGGEAPIPAPAGPRGKIVIFHAASLARPFAELERTFERSHPGTDVVRESSSSRIAIRKVTELNRAADIVATADDRLLRELMFPAAASWCVVFVRNRVVIGFTDRSRYSSSISADNWYDVLLRRGVQFGYANPNMAPVGYRTLLCWKLANLYYHNRLAGRDLFEALRAACPPQNIRPHVNELLPPLESLRLDYVFLYRSVAMQHNLKWIKLPDEIDLGNEKLAEKYARVSVEIAGKTRGSKLVQRGRPITYGLCIPAGAPNRDGAVAFLSLLLGERGRNVMEQNFQEPIFPSPCYGFVKVPAALKPLLTPVSEETP